MLEVFVFGIGDWFIFKNNSIQVGVGDFYFNVGGFDLAGQALKRVIKARHGEHVPVPFGIEDFLPLVRRHLLRRFGAAIRSRAVFFHAVGNEGAAGIDLVSGEVIEGIATDGDGDIDGAAAAVDGGAAGEPFPADGELVAAEIDRPEAGGDAGFYFVNVVGEGLFETAQSSQ